MQAEARTAVLVAGLGMLGVPAQGAPSSAEPVPKPTAVREPPERAVSGDEELEPEDAPFPNPFAHGYDEPLGWLGVGVQLGSVLGDAFGGSVAFVPWSYLEIELAYGYRTEHAVAPTLKYNVLPYAWLTPTLTVGYAAGVAPLHYGIKLTSHYLVAALGLQARVAGNYFVAAELAGRGLVEQTLRDQQQTYQLSPDERFGVQFGFSTGAYLP